jgi:hypothetical protein
VVASKSGKREENKGAGADVGIGEAVVKSDRSDIRFAGF